MNKKIAVVGSSGFVGKNVYSVLKAANRVVGIARSDSPFVDRRADVTRKAEIQKVLDEENPDVVVDCAYYPNVEGCETDPGKSAEININGVNNVIDWCAGNRRKLIFISTDYVYSLNGDRLNSEADKVGSLNVYTSQKLLNERDIARKLSDFLILRTGFIYGFDQGGKNFLMQMLDSNGKMNIPLDQFVNPTYVGYLAGVIERAIERDARGIFNANGKEAVSRQDFACQIAKSLALGNMPVGIKTSEINYKAKRPLFCQVDSSALEALLGVAPKPNEHYLAEIRDLIKNQRDGSRLL